jgi:molybdate/tungstate transport system ATP-binding protein
MPPAMIELEKVELRAGDFGLEAISFQVERGEYVALMGRTGSGKTTILEGLCGLRKVRRGRIHIDASDVTDLPPAARGIGYVPQDGALFPTMTVREQLCFGPRLRGWKLERIEARVAELSRDLEIEPLLDRTPRGLSGGERQRIALGRAVSSEPAVLCLDEPLGALDEESRERMFLLLARLRDRTAFTALHVTHDRREAERLASRILLVEEISG